MPRYLLLLFVTVGAADALTCSTAKGPKCDDNIFLCCNTNFESNLNLTKCTGDVFQRVQCYRNEVENLFGTSVDGGLNVCSAFSSWMNCLGQSLMDCESVRYHVATGLTTGQARLVATVYAQISFLCGPGLDTYVNQDTCIRGVFTTYATQLQRCRDIFSNNLQNNFENRCTDFRELLGCYQLPFQKSCDTEGGWFGCEYERSGVTGWLPECSEQCTAVNNDFK